MSEMERQRAQRNSIRAILAEFRKHPKSAIGPMLAAVALELEGEEEAPQAPSVAADGRAKVAGPFLGTFSKAEGIVRAPAPNGSPLTFADRALAALADLAPGRTMNATELGAVLYGPDDADAREKARAVMHGLFTRKRVHKPSEGNWAFGASAEDSDDDAVEGDGELEEGTSAPAVVRRVLGTATKPMGAAAIYEAAQKIDPNIDKGNVYSALSKLKRKGALKQTGGSTRSMVYALAQRDD